MTFQNETEMIQFLHYAGYKVTPPTEQGHWLILRGGGGQVIGCTTSRIDVLFEEPTAVFFQVKPEDCPSCKGESGWGDLI